MEAAAGSMLDGILYNLIATKQLYEFEINHVRTLIDLITRLHNEKQEELSAESVYFDKKFEEERNAFISLLRSTEAKLKKISDEIVEKQQGKEKLTSLFEMLGQLNEKENQMNNQNLTSREKNEDFEIMEIREELDEDGNIVNSSVNPYGKSLDVESKKVTSSTPQGKPTETQEISNLEQEEQGLKDDLATTSDFDPIMIREELDENSNIVSGKLVHPITQGVTNSNATEKSQERNEVAAEEEVDEDQIAELLADMGLKETAKIEEIASTSSEIQPDKLEDAQQLEPRSTPTALGGAISQEDLLTLEVIADELDNEEDEDYVKFADDEEWDFDEDDEDEEDFDEDDEEEEDGEPDYSKGFVPGKAGNLFMQQLQSLRSARIEPPLQKVTETTDIVDDNTPKSDANESSDKEVPKPKKSVSFANTVEVNEVENIWKEMNENSSKPTKVSAFKQRLSQSNQKPPQQIETNSNIREVSNNDDAVLLDLHDTAPVLDDIVESVPFIAPKQVTPTSMFIAQTNPSNRKINSAVNKQEGSLNLSKISKFKYNKQMSVLAPAIFKSQLINVSRDSEVVEDQSDMGKVEDSSSLSVSNKANPFLKKSFGSLIPRSIKKQSHFSTDTAKTTSKISVPKETNPEVANAEYMAERESGIPVMVNDSLEFDDVEHMEDLQDSEFSARNAVPITSNTKEVDSKNQKMPEQKEKDDEKLQIVDTTLDYQSLQADMDTMAKAYVLGLYDDDIQTEGELIEQLEDFEKMNKIVAQRDAEKKKNTLLEYGENTTGINMDIDQGLEAIPKELDEIDGDNHDGAEEEEEDDGPVLSSTIIEHTNTMDYDDLELDPEVDSIGTNIPDPDLDISLSPEVLNQSVALEYVRLRKKMMSQYNGGFKKTDKELELEPIDEFGNEVKVSRFKAAKLATRNPKDLV